jgi:hypothetical protein
MGVLLSTSSLSAANALVWDGSYPQGGVQQVKVKGTYTTDPGWTCIAIYVTVMDMSNNQTTGSVTYSNPASPWGVTNISAPNAGGGSYQAFVVVTAVFFRNGTTTTHTIDAIVTVL